MSPTNILRKASTKPVGRGARRGGARTRREILIRAGAVALRARLLDTPTADLVWQTLPIYSTAETRGALVHFETHVDTGLESEAVWTVKPGELAFWVEEDRIVIGYGTTPMSRPGEIRLPSRCNVWAIAVDDVAALAGVRPGESVAVLEADS